MESKFFFFIIMFVSCLIINGCGKESQANLNEDGNAKETATEITPEMTFANNIESTIEKNSQESNWVDVEICTDPNCYPDLENNIIDLIIENMPNRQMIQPILMSKGLSLLVNYLYGDDFSLNKTKEEDKVNVSWLSKGSGEVTGEISSVLNQAIDVLDNPEFPFLIKRIMMNYPEDLERSTGSILSAFVQGTIKFNYYQTDMPEKFIENAKSQAAQLFYPQDTLNQTIKGRIYLCHFEVLETSGSDISLKCIFYINIDNIEQPSD